MRRAASSVLTLITLFFLGGTRPGNSSRRSLAAMKWLCSSKSKLLLRSDDVSLSLLLVLLHVLGGYRLSLSDSLDESLSSSPVESKRLADMMEHRYARHMDIDMPEEKDRPCKCSMCKIPDGQNTVALAVAIIYPDCQKFAAFRFFEYGNAYPDKYGYVLE
ncbi:hypothetical protein Bhyg_04545 [Pseudolycoriella hygida]|uniref:Uncharacterized protein n=1 Tax=Pseudolycoriella hygida TaxID=35572 RepID=A0A9Q0NGR3_9DIPT|nr:hypothetical protein Bhyg_04545 [Pseudolycoriella hygida]